MVFPTFLLTSTLELLEKKKNFRVVTRQKEGGTETGEFDARVPVIWRAVRSDTQTSVISVWRLG